MELSQGSDVGPPPHPPGRSAGGAFKDKKEREGRGGGRMVRAAWFTPDWSPHTPPFIRNYNTITVFYSSFTGLPGWQITPVAAGMIRASSL